MEVIMYMMIGIILGMVISYAHSFYWYKKIKQQWEETLKSYKSLVKVHRGFIDMLMERIHLPPIEWKEL